MTSQSVLEKMKANSIEQRIFLQIMGRSQCCGVSGCNNNVPGNEMSMQFPKNDIV